MVRDAGGSLWGAIVFAAVLLSPGYCFGYWLDLCRFRTCGLREQLAWTLVLSVGLGTLPLVGIVWLAGLNTAAALVVLLSILAAFLFARSQRIIDFAPGEARVLSLIAGTWAFLVIGSLIDVGLHSRLWMSVTVYDHWLRTAFTDSVLRTGVPPVNPAYWPGHAAPMRYYYFWYVTCAVVARLAHISARQAFIASCVWPFFGVAAMLALFGKYLLGWRAARLRSHWRVAMVLLGITGLDLLVVLVHLLGGNPVFADMEWWAVDQVTSWMDTFLWVPHHAAALVCCLVSILLLFLASVENELKRRYIFACTAGLSFASAFGLSTYVAVATAITLGLWLVWRLFHSDRQRVITITALATAVAGVALSPYLVQLLHHESGYPVSTSHVLGFGVRQILQPSVLFGLPGLNTLQHTHPQLATNLAVMLLLIPCYGIELGFFAAALFVMQRAAAKTAGERTLLFFTWAGLFSASFFRSQVIVTNDYAIRATLLPQFMLLLVGVLALQRCKPWSRRALLGLALIGMSGTFYQMILLRTFLPWQQVHGTPLAELAERSYDLRDAYAALQTRIPASARLQYDVAADGYFNYPHLLDAQRQIVTAEHDCNASFGGEITPCGRILNTVNRLFPDAALLTPTAEAAMELCRSIGADYLVATRWDTVWKAPGKWVWTLPAVVDRPAVRVLDCTHT